MEKSEQDLEARVARSADAKRLRDSSLLTEFISNLREATIKNLSSSHWKDVDEREELYKMLKVIDAFEREFKRAIDDGKIAVSLLDSLRQKIGI